ncbi:MAG TPA: hypothetical protein P5117_00600, partial [Spirochaetia bacterium]|nr:hypothetical protein [Spirochaetia bacterium]
EHEHQREKILEDFLFVRHKNSFRLLIRIANASTAAAPACGAFEPARITGALSISPFFLGPFIPVGFSSFR